MIYVVAATLLLTILPVNSITALVRDSEEECFFDESQSGDQIHGTFAVTAGDVTMALKVFDPDDKTILHLMGTSEDSFTFIAQSDGFYTVCFQNEGDEIATVEFGIHIGDELKIKNVVTEDHFSPIETALVDLRKGIDELNDQIGYHRNRLKRHKKTTKSTGNRVMIWAIVEGVVLISVSLLQTFMTTRLFEKKQKV